MRTWYAICLLMTAICVHAAGFSAADVSLTVYNNDLAVVKLVEDMVFEKGVTTKTLTGVADRIDPTSVRFSAKKGGVTVLEQNYRYDLVNSTKVLDRYLDQRISLVMGEGDLLEGILKSVAGDIVLTDDAGRTAVIRADAVERFDLPALPDGLVTRPTLFWTLKSDLSGKVPTEVSYMTGGFSWHAEYTAVVSDDETSMELSSWVSIDNRSGASFRDAGLKLVAGDVHRVRPEKKLQRARMPMALMEDEAAGFEERGLFEYHLYDLGRRTDVMNAEIKQIALFDPARVAAEKRFVYDSRKNPSKVAVSVEFENTEKDGLGIALPAGKVRVFKRDSDGELEFVGEDAVDHTPKNERVRLTLGHAFDIVAERTVTDSRRISQRVREETVEIALRNRKEKAVTVTAVEHFWGDWEVRTSSRDFVKKDAFTAEWIVEVPADGETKITYTVRMQ